MDAKAPNQGGGFVKKKRRKRGGGAGGPQTSANNNTKDASGGGGPSAAGRGGGKGGGSKKRRGGGGGGRGGGGGGGESSRFGRNASSPLQLPHVKVTLRNIGDANKHGTMEGVVDAVRSFLEGAFPAVASAEDSELNPYMIAWQMEKEEFDSAKNMFAEDASIGGGGDAASRAFSSGWLYEEKPSSLPSDRLSLIPTAEAIVTDLMNNNTDKKVTNSSNINFIVDTAMSQMMQECGKKYLSFVGGQIVFDEESAVDVVLAEKVQAERKKLAEEEKKKKLAEEEEKRLAEEKILAEEEQEEIITEADDVSSDQPSNTTENVTAEKKDETTSVEAVTKGIEKLSTSDKPPAKQQVFNQMPMIRIRILSATPMKKSKRRGEIAGKIQLAMYPPDPCLLFKETCRDAGTMAAEKHLENAAKVASESAGGENMADKDGPGKEIVSPDGKDEVEVDIPKDAEDANSKPPSPAIEARFPQIPYYPLLSPAERSRAVARSRVLLNRSIEAMKLHAAAQSKNSRDKEVHSWEVMESSSQKTWKGRPNPMVGSMMAGTPLRDLVVEHEAEKSSVSGATAAKKGRRGFYGDSRADRYDSTIENSEDYNAFMESLRDGSDPSSLMDQDVAKKNGDSKSAVEPPPPAVDEEGRPLSAIVMHLREKQAESAKARAEVVAAASKARAAAAGAKERMRKEKLKTKKDASKKRKKEVARSKKSSSRASSSRPVISGSYSSRPVIGGGGSGSRASSSRPMSSSSSRPVSGGGSKDRASMPPPGAMLLKKGGVSAIPPSGFGVP
mmetsp:Transcript_8769/g.15965  ORF Transcript_8769/g.15965 Transcript_8769/m.15965 type:complete len:785 (+) Transcript_8769:38-2392(+)|eukprot:CAMPEP_0201869208 /NCGR_PEP_ID=MMETSP0902-20130614/2808_1 /ASSEMBLY_ACC=CAM_ASM_000551 /TAXON_ID=420261 /ORGANISM="Thalassiosira antarctica, Strain CCMP982" /LENGTH=784 /DNA_ID=CAMNT_0048394673 /DNA_START=29 /DNA_END=2383 /DNA_ORIENTATION=+